MRQVADTVASVDWNAAAEEGTIVQTSRACVRYAQAAQEEWRAMRDTREHLYLAIVDEVCYEVWSAFPFTRQGRLNEVQIRDFA